MSITQGKIGTTQDWNSHERKRVLERESHGALALFAWDNKLMSQLKPGTCYGN